MTELRHHVEKSDLYDRLIDRLGLALDMAKTAVRLREDDPLELELRGLSRAEFQFIEAYLGRSEVVAKDPPINTASATPTTPREPSQLSRGVQPAANVIWLKDLRRAKVSAKLSRYSPGKHSKR